MKRNFTNENFEHFLRQNVDGLRMRPSDRPWKGISKRINRPRRRIAFLLASLLMISAGISYSIIHLTPKQIQTGRVTYATIDHHMATDTKPDRVKEKILTIKHSVPVTKSLHNLLINPSFNNLGKLSEISDQTVSGRTSFNEFNSVTDDSYPDNEKNYTNTAQVKKQFAYKPVENIYPLSIESVVNTYQVVNSYKKVQRKPTSFQYYFTPTVSYRKLQEHKTVIRSTVPLGISSYQTSMYNINNAVTQKPDIGFEIGMAVKHAVSRNLKLRGGLQFNVNRYDVRVFNSPNQLSTIRLNTDNNPDYLSTVTNYSNFTGNHSDWLQNFYFQVSAPVGIELKLRGDDNIQFGIASTIQPTYILGERAYLISSDYKTYAEVPGLLKHTNINTSLETFVSYSSGRYTWQVGPQVRYQLFSSFVKTYSVKEHLLDFGLKIGISPIR